MQIGKISSLKALALVAMLAGCGSAPQGASEADAPEVEQFGSGHQFLVWNPSGNLLNEHTAWHNNTCDTAGARRCTLRGEEFLTFHRDFLARLRDSFEAQGLVADTTPWITIPAAMKNSGLWTTADQAAENAVTTMIDPDTGLRFASLDRFGTFVELYLHNRLHPIASVVYEQTVGPINMSPRSSYFFNIHGWVEYQFQRFQHGDFNKDGFTDLIQRNFNGTNSIRLMNGTGTASNVAIPTVGVDSCRWYVGAQADFNLDGNIDIVWHGPGCNAVYVWLMNGTTYLSSVALPSVGSDWELVGAGDFNQDMRPDLVWYQYSTSTLSFWRMNRTAYQASINRTLPAAATDYPTLAVDYNNNGIADLILSHWDSATSTRSYRVLNMTANFTLGTVSSLSSVLNSSQFTSIVGAGRFQNTNSYSDFVMQNVSGMGQASGYSIALRGSGNSYSFPANSTTSLTGGTVIGPQ